MAEQQTQQQTEPQREFEEVATFGHFRRWFEALLATHSQEVGTGLVLPNAPLPYAPCAICQEFDVELFCIPARPGVERRQGVVLICGHMFCAECYQGHEDTKIAQQSLDDPRPVTCPMCRHDLHFVDAHCNHVYRSVMIPQSLPPPHYTAEPMLALLDIPATRSDTDGGYTPTSCHDCRYNRTHAMGSILEVLKTTRNYNTDEAIINVIVLMGYTEAEASLLLPFPAGSDWDGLQHAMNQLKRRVFKEHGQLWSRTKIDVLSNIDYWDGAEEFQQMLNAFNDGPAQLWNMEPAPQ
ncbi:hypothetical protein QBC43DRAFT_335122 [Cladorrhinum sp. PSN259]|nr:hypothetical protein QBC43DRAFT_335122 [Cladorrhinum sp. PSN259]